jgi:hypothetical protein
MLPFVVGLERGDHPTSMRGHAEEPITLNLHWGKSPRSGDPVHDLPVIWPKPWSVTKGPASPPRSGCRRRSKVARFLRGCFRSFAGLFPLSFQPSSTPGRFFRSPT